MLRISSAINAMLTVFAVALLVAFAPPVKAEEAELLLGRGFLCDTADEVQNAIKNADDEITASLASVHGRYGEGSCSFATAFFRSADEVRTFQSKNGAVPIVKVQVVGYLDGHELTQVDPPVAQYFAAFDLPGPKT